MCAEHGLFIIEKTEESVGISPIFTVIRKSLNI